MIPTYQPGTLVNAIVTYPAAVGVSNPATAISYSVLDENEDEIVAEASVAIPGSPGSVTIVVPAESNALPDGALRTMRIVRVIFTDTTGAMWPVDYRYIIVATNKLVLMTNSFQTLEQSILGRTQLAALEGWDEATDDELVAGMSSAFQNLCALTYRYRLSQQAIDFNAMFPDEIQFWVVTDMNLRTMDDWNDWPTHFQAALQRAQIIETDNILSGDPVGDKRADGIISETTGESKMFFNTKPPLRFPICRAAMIAMGPFLYSRNTLRRA